MPLALALLPPTLTFSSLAAADSLGHFLLVVVNLKKDEAYERIKKAEDELLAKQTEAKGLREEAETVEAEAKKKHGEADETDAFLSSDEFKVRRAVGLTSPPLAIASACLCRLANAALSPLSTRLLRIRRRRRRRSGM